MKVSNPVLLILLAFGGSMNAHAAGKDSTAVKALLDRGYQYEQSNKDSAILMYRMAIEESKSIGYDLGAVRGHRYLGIVFSDMARYGEAVANYQKSVEMAVAINNKTEEAKSLTNLGTVYYFQGIYKESLIYFLAAARLMEEKNDTSILPTLYTNLGSLYDDLKEFPKAIEYHSKCIRLAVAEHDTLSISIANLNLGNSFFSLNQLDSADKHYAIGLSFARSLGDAERMYAALNNYASFYKATGDFRKAVTYGLEALEWANKTENPESISWAKISCGVYYSHLGNPDLTMKYLNEGLEISEKNRFIPNLAAGYEFRFAANLKLGRIEAAQRDYDRSVYYEDSLRSEQKSIEIGAIQGKYELEKELRERRIEEEKLMAAAQESRDRRDRIQYFIISLLLIALFVLVKRVRQFRISAKASHLLTLISILLFFEFLLVILDPYIDSLSGSVPVYKLILNLMLAVAISPFHVWLLKVFGREASETIPRAV